MAETLIARTFAEGLRPLGPAAQRNHALIVEMVESRLSSAHALMFSEPSPTPDGVATDWYAQMTGPVRRLDELGAEEAEAARTRIGELTRDVLALANELDEKGGEADRRLVEALRNAVEVPDGSAVWLVGDQPVLVTWAHSRDIDKAPRGVIRRFIPVEPRPPPAPEMATTRRGRLPSRYPPPPAPEMAPPVLAVERRGPGEVLWWLGWLLLAILIFWGLYLLIAPCGLHGPAIFNFVCPRDALYQEAERREGLEDRIAALERDLNRLGNTCAPEPYSPVDAVVEQGGKIGAVNIILSWEGHVALDLHVQCPSGERIYHANRNACGGTLDTDANIPTRQPAYPVENVVFDDSPEPGPYVIEVRLYDQRTDTARSRYPFTVTIIADGHETVHDAMVTTSDRNWNTTLDYGVNR